MAKKIISERGVGSSSLKADKILKECNIEYEKEKENNIKEAEKKADIKLFDRLFKILDNNPNLAVWVEPSKVEDNENYQYYDKKLFNSYVLNAKNKNIYVADFNVDKATLNEDQSYIYHIASLKSKQESYTSGYSGTADSSGHVSLSPDTSYATEYYLVTEEITGTIKKRILHYKFVKADKMQEAINKEKEYAPSFNLHNNYLLYEKNIKNPVTKSACTINNTFLFLTKVSNLLFNIFAVISVLFSYFRIYNVGNTKLFLNFKNFTLSVWFLIPFLTVFFVHFLATVVFKTYSKKFKYLKAMQKVKEKDINKDILNSEEYDEFAFSFHWDEDGWIKIYYCLAFVGLVVCVGSIMLATINHIACSIVSSILTVLFLLISISYFISSISDFEVIKYNDWNQFVSGMKNFSSSGQLEKCEKLVCEIKRFTVKNFKP